MERYININALLHSVLHTSEYTVLHIRIHHEVATSCFSERFFEHKYFGAGSKPTEEEIEEMIDVRIINLKRFLAFYKLMVRLKNCLTHALKI